MRVFTTVCQSMLVSLCFIVLFTKISNRVDSFIKKLTKNKTGVYVISIFLTMCWFGVVGTILG